LKTLLIALIALCASATAFAGGKLTAQPMYFMDSGKVGTTFGLSVYQAIAPALAINAWGGVGVHPYDTHTVVWKHAHADLEFYSGRMSYAFGAGLTSSSGYEGVDDNIHVKVGYQLW
jgi:hypothetical protein